MWRHSLATRQHHYYFFRHSVYFWNDGLYHFARLCSDLFCLFPARAVNCLQLSFSSKELPFLKTRHAVPISLTLALGLGHPLRRRQVLLFSTHLHGRPFILWLPSMLAARLPAQHIARHQPPLIVLTASVPELVSLISMSSNPGFFMSLAQQQLSLTATSPGRPQQTSESSAMTQHKCCTRNSPAKDFSFAHELT